MPETILGNKKFENIPSIKSKALRINLNKNIYGISAEIGAGQETVSNFFRACGASGTIAKTMSAYDKYFSDAILQCRRGWQICYGGQAFKEDAFA